MTAPSVHVGDIDRSYQLDDRYLRENGRVFMSGSQALVRLPMLQRQRDRAAGLNTAGFISGYTGSPLGGYDIALKKASELLVANHIHFQPGINEDLGATAVWGSQQVELMDGARYDGVFGIWYGKGPGVDRSGDALKHGSYAGSSANGGVLVLAGDDHGAKSSTTAHQSDHAFIHFGMPYLNPSSVQDYIDFGLHGFALSRFSGCWIGMKCVTDTIESSASVEIAPDRIAIRIPAAGKRDNQRNARWGTPALAAEARQYQDRIPAVLAYIRLNRLDRPIISAKGARNLAIVTTGKAFLDVMQALEDIGLAPAEAARRGVSVYKVAMPWPIEPEGILAFIEGHREILVIEEKRSIIEDQLARLLVNRADHAPLTGKFDAQGQRLIPSEGELNSALLVPIIGDRISALSTDREFLARLRGLQPDKPQPIPSPSALVRMPSFCAGCPHNTSTKVPDGSMAFGGIGCHGMATFLPERSTPTLFQMGGEGAPWIGISPFTETTHIFQNLGDGTYYHSGLLAIRAAVAADVNITYKILVNDAIAMTGGQEIEGQMRVDQLTKQVHAEGVKAIAVVTDDPEQYARDADFAPGTSIYHRRELDTVQRRMRETLGVTIIVYDQNCATELRRRRKRGKAPDPDIRTFINNRVCEGCGDCSVQSNCIAIEPIETQYGRKRKINQSACNKDLSCLEGYCPSFVTIKGAKPKKRGASGRGSCPDDVLTALPAPELVKIDNAFSILVTGIGGSGVVTLGSILGMAAHLEGKGCSVLDVTGLAQRNGPVMSHIRIAKTPDVLKATRITRADLVIGSDIVVTASADVLIRMDPVASLAVVNNHVAPTSAFASNPNLDMTAQPMEAAVSQRASHAAFIDASAMATALMGSEVAANLMLVGFAVQKGWLPISLAAIDRAIELNETAVELNRSALAWGRAYAFAPEVVRRHAFPEAPAETHPTPAPAFETLVADNTGELERYQDRKLANRYLKFVERARQAEQALSIDSEDFAIAVARYFYKLLAYKDEYEVARLLSAPAFRKSLHDEFEGGLVVEYHMAPPIFQRRDARTGRYRKRRFGAWMGYVLRVLARGRVLRGTRFDLFGYSAHRKLERALISEYEREVGDLIASLNTRNHTLSVRIASLPEMIRGYDMVKDHHVEKMQSEKRKLLDQWRLAEPQVFTEAPSTYDFSHV